MTTKSIKPNSASSRILAFVAENPMTTASQIATNLNISKGTVGPTVKTLRDEGRLTVATERDEFGDTVEVTFPVVDANGVPTKGRPGKALKVTDKGRRTAQRILAKLQEETVAA